MCVCVPDQMFIYLTSERIHKFIIITSLGERERENKKKESETNL